MRVAVHGDLSERELKRLAETLRREAAQLEAVSLVQLFGVRQEEVSIEVSEDAMRRYNLSFSEVAHAVRNTSINQSVGQVRTEVGTYQLKVRSQADTEAEFNKIIIRETADGAIIRVGDVATVIDGLGSDGGFSLRTPAPDCPAAGAVVAVSRELFPPLHPVRSSRAMVMIRMLSP